MYKDPVELIEEIMQKMQFNQQLVASRIGIPQNTLSRILSRKNTPTLKNYKKIIECWQKVNNQKKSVCI